MRFIDKTKELWNTEKGNAKRSFLKLILAVPFWLILASVVLIAFGTGRAVYLIDTRPDQRVAEIWQSSSDVSFRHMSVYAGGIRAQGDKSPLTYTEAGKSIHLADIALMRKDLQGSTDTGSAASTKNIKYVECGENHLAYLYGRNMLGKDYAYTPDSEYYNETQIFILAGLIDSYIYEDKSPEAMER